MSHGYPTDHLTNGYSPAGSNNYANSNNQPTDGRQAEYSQSGLSSPYHPYSGQDSEEPMVEQASAAHFPQTQDVKFSPGQTPTSEYGLSTPVSRPGQFPEYMQQRAQYPDGTQRYHAPVSQGGGPGHLAQPSSLSAPFEDGEGASHEDAHDASSDDDASTGSSTVVASPTYAQSQYSPYTQQHELPQYQPAPGAMYARADYGAYHGVHPHAMAHYGHMPGGVPTHASLMPSGPRPPGGGHPMSTVYSFVPIPGTHQQKRPRRRFEEIERMYRCGYGDCEKAYGTLNHLNAHVSMQGHGNKRTPEEFKEIRKEWKQKKKEEDALRKADDERARQQMPQQNMHMEGIQSSVDNIQQQANVYPQPPRQLPPIGYAPAGGPVNPPQYGQPGQDTDGLPPYTNASMNGYYPQPSYGPGSGPHL